MTKQNRSTTASENGDAAPEEGTTLGDDRETAKQNAADQNTEQVEELLDIWEATCEAGEPLPIDTLCQDHPDLASEVRERIVALNAVDEQLAKRKKRKHKRSRTLPPLEIATLVGDLTFLNAGGLGEVYVGEDDGLRRRVAVKFMHKALCDSDDRQSQFLLEAEVTGRLEHPGVVPLYGFGRTDDGRPFYAMRFIDGETLDDAIKRYFRLVDDAHHHSGQASDTDIAMEFRRLLGSFTSLCKTIAYAHNRGIVHRDIKPANVMLGRFGETIVVDWGLAVPVMRDERFRQSGEETLQISPSGSHSSSSSGRGAGTPAFMSPEQFSHLAPTPASDIYSLGATLFVILCGRPPIKNTALSDIRTDTIEGRLPDLSEIRHDIPRPLQAIAYKAMAREAKDRYPTALDLARDVERFLADEPIMAAEDSLGLRLARLARKHRAAAQTAVLGLLGCLLIAGVSTVIMRGSRNTAQMFRQQHQATSARFIARSFGHEIDRIWRVLEFEAASPEISRLVTDANELIAGGESITLENQSELQVVLERRLLTHETLPFLQKMFLLSKDGTQVARAPMPEEPQVGQNFAFRDYYTGMGYDLPPESKLVRLIDEPLVGPVVYPSGVHMSNVYLSTQADERRLKVTFTVPIRTNADDPTSQCIGLLGTSVDVGAMMLSVIEGSRSWVADMRDDTVEGKRKRGLLLAYPKRDVSIDPASSDPLADLPRLPSEIVEQIEREDYHYDQIVEIDHLLGENDLRAAIQPIKIDGRGAEPVNLGWVVITAEKP